MKAIIYIPSFTDTQTLFPVLQQIRLFFPEIPIRISCSIKDKERLNWLHSHANMFQFAILEVQNNSLKDQLIGLREVVLEARKEARPLWVLNGRVLVNEQIAKELKLVVKRNKRIGLVGVPTVDEEGHFINPYLYFKPFASGQMTHSERRVPLSCTLISLDFLEKMNPNNLLHSEKPPSFYLSSLARKLGYQNGILNRVKTQQLSIPEQKKSTIFRLFNTYLFRNKRVPLEL